MFQFQILTMDHPVKNGVDYRKHTQKNSQRLNHNNPKSAPSTPNKAVNFQTNTENEKSREKYLTAKYGAHQMALIRKRLKVEMWMFDQLQEMTESEVRLDLSSSLWI